jgi:hypothetical protein
MGTGAMLLDRDVDAVGIALTLPLRRRVNVR